ncbi:Mating type protein [Penicillium riverlandense]|uniref:Mating type protein n=1 Tax=Penicillium riverlandense TaxID=1903569 RepID=UPI002549B573|nr:Mating type protein [Penicillium riverlandense]KAJ5819776.1 Mating type protein [Penicillium riverlandense]
MATTESLTQLQFFGYLSSLHANEAQRILSGWNSSATSMEDYAATVIDSLPQELFEHTLPTSPGPYYIYANGIFSLMPPRRPQEYMAQLQTYDYEAEFDAELDAEDDAEDDEQLQPAPAPAVTPAPAPAREAGTTRRLRPLNSFMVFRSYYATLFPGMPQKFKSSAISNLWAKETLKPKWAILAKAYTTIRDDYDVDTPSLPDFIELTAPLIGVPEPAEYLQMSGWKIVKSTEGYDLMKTGPSRVKEELVAAPPINIEDVIEFCESVDYCVPKERTTPAAVQSALALNHAQVTIHNGTVVINEPINLSRVVMDEWDVEEIYPYIHSVIDADIQPNFDPEFLDPNFDVGFDFEFPEFLNENFLNENVV